MTRRIILSFIVIHILGQIAYYNELALEDSKASCKCPWRDFTRDFTWIFMSEKCLKSGTAWWNGPEVQLRQ